MHIASISVVAFAACSVILANEELDYTVKLTTVSSGWDGKKCWVHSRAGAIPARSPGDSRGPDFARRHNRHPLYHFAGPIAAGEVARE